MVILFSTGKDTSRRGSPRANRAGVRRGVGFASVAMKELLLHLLTKFRCSKPGLGQGCGYEQGTWLDSFKGHGMMKRL